MRFTLSTTALPMACRRLSKAAVAIIAETVNDKDLLYNLDLILSEAWSNVVRHAYKDQPPGPFEISLIITPFESVRLEVADWGRGFPSLPLNIKNAQPDAEGGRGLFIMSKLSNDFAVTRQGQKNIVQVTISVRKELWKPIE